MGDNVRNLYICTVDFMPAPSYLHIFYNLSVLTYIYFRNATEGHFSGFSWSSVLKLVLSLESWLLAKPYVTSNDIGRTAHLFEKEVKIKPVSRE